MAAENLGKLAWRATLSGPDYDDIITASRTGLWLGRGAHLVHYPLRASRDLNLVLIGDAEAESPHYLLDHFDAHIRQLAAPAKWVPWPLLQVDPAGRWASGRAALIGDAAHAIVPFHGQGMNLAFEDCMVLEHFIQQHGSDWANVFARFEAEQLANANAIADMALDNYVEMRDTVRDAGFALRKQLAFELERRLPGTFIPRYSMVMFHADIPYLAAQRRGEVQNALLEEFTGHAHELAGVDEAHLVDRGDFARGAAELERLLEIFVSRGNAGRSRAHAGIAVVAGNAGLAGHRRRPPPDGAARDA